MLIKWFGSSPSRLLIIKLIIILVSVLLYSKGTWAETYQFSSATQEQRYQQLINEFRCPKCQNQNLAGSDSVISKNLRHKTYEMVTQGKTDAQIRDYMINRYGDFITYKPPVKASTSLLWFLPPLMLLTLLAWWLLRKNRTEQNISNHEQMRLSDSEQVELNVLLAPKNTNNNHEGDNS